MQPSRQVPAVLLSFLFRPPSPSSSPSAGDGKVFRHPLFFQLPQPFLLALVKALLQHARHVAARETRGGASGGASGASGGGVSGGQGVQDVLAKGGLEVLRHLMPVEVPSGNNSISLCVREVNRRATEGQQWDNRKTTGGPQEDNRRTTGGQQEDNSTTVGQQ